jgi:hypothetical protein
MPGRGIEDDRWEGETEAQPAGGASGTHQLQNPNPINQDSPADNGGVTLDAVAQENAQSQ